MLKKTLLLLWAVLILLSGDLINSRADADQSSFENVNLSTLQFKRIAVMPFLVGKLESPENPVEKPLSQPVRQLSINAANLAEGADQIMTRLVNDVMQTRFADQMVSMEEAAAVYADVIRDQTLGTPRKLSKNSVRTCRRILCWLARFGVFGKKGPI